MGIVGTRVRTLREAKRRTQQELAAESGVSVTTISRYENGRVSMFSANVLGRLAAALDVDPALLLIVGDAPPFTPRPEPVREIDPTPLAPGGPWPDVTWVTKQFRALADENRLRIVDLLRRQERCVCDLTETLALRQSLLSFHLKALKDAGLVTDRRQGRWAYYALNRHAFVQLEAFVGALPAVDRGVDHGVDRVVDLVVDHPLDRAAG
jgi:ArsR family transcriptional regulator